MPQTPDAQTPDAQPVDAAPSYEAARDELAEVVSSLETGGLTLEESLRLWERGEELAALCQAWLDAARVRLDSVSEATDGSGGSPDRA